jgi:hypothetical protein
MLVALLPAGPAISDGLPARAPSSEASQDMSRSYIRSSDGATMVEIAPHQYVNRKLFRLRERLDDGYQQGKIAGRRQKRLQSTPKLLDGDVIAGLVHQGLAAAKRESMKTGGKPVQVVGIRITDTGRRAIEG